MTVTLNSHDLCVQGYERLRRNSEFMLVVPVTNDMTRADVLAALQGDVQSCMRPDDFDWDGCEAMLQENFGGKDRLQELFAPELEDVGEDEDSCYLFLYCEQA